MREALGFSEIGVEEGWQNSDVLLPQPAVLLCISELSEKITASVTEEFHDIAEQLPRLHS